MKTIKIIDTIDNTIILNKEGDEILKYKEELEELKGYTFYTDSVLGKIKITKIQAIENSFLNSFSKFFAVVNKNKKVAFCYRTPSRDRRCGEKEIKIVIEED